MNEGQKRTSLGLGLAGLFLWWWWTRDGETSVTVTTENGEPVRQALCYDGETNEYYDCDDPTYRVPGPA